MHDMQNISHESTKKRFQPNNLPEEIESKFEQIKDKELDFHAKSELLKWFVDEMRQEVINHFEKENIVQKMEGPKQV